MTDVWEVNVHFFYKPSNKNKICEIFPRLDKHLIFDIETQNVNRSFYPRQIITEIK